MDPSRSSWPKNIRGMLISARGPLVEPQKTIRPPGRAARSDWSRVSGPTCSKTTSTPVPTAAFTAFAKSSDGNAASAPSPSARCRFSSLRLVASTCAPRCVPIAIAAAATPAPAPTTSIVSPGWSLARVTIIRQAVRNVSGNAAASAHESPRGLAKTFSGATCTNWQAVPSVCSPRMPNPGANTCRPARLSAEVQSQVTG